jgi:carbon-monoxide dehydrogenase iron sulfur subunit
MGRYSFAIQICRHCEAPECLHACPAGAITLDERGVALIDDQACTRCGACAAACPYQALLYCEGEDRYLKCDLCAGREDGALCVALCPAGALTMAGRQQGRQG